MDILVNFFLLNQYFGQKCEFFWELFLSLTNLNETNMTMIFYRYNINETDMTSIFTNTISTIPIWFETIVAQTNTKKMGTKWMTLVMTITLRYSCADVWLRFCADETQPWLKQPKLSTSPQIIKAIFLHKLNTISWNCKHHHTKTWISYCKLQSETEQNLT